MPWSTFTKFLVSLRSITRKVFSGTSPNSNPVPSFYKESKLFQKKHFDWKHDSITFKVVFNLVNFSIKNRSFSWTIRNALVLVIKDSLKVTFGPGPDRLCKIEHLAANLTPALTDFGVAK